MNKPTAEYALNSSSMIPPEMIVPMMIIDCDDGTALSDGNKLNK